MKYFLCFVFIPVFLYAQTKAGPGSVIKKEELMKTVSLLCEDEYAGRLPGHQGYQKAADYMADEFESLGLKPINGSYFQELFVEYNEILPPLKFNLISKEKIVKEYKPGKDYVCRGFTGSGDVKSEIVFCGYGKDEEFYNDYKDVDVRNKIIMIFKPNPSWKIDNKEWGSGYPRAKSNAAAKYGAAGIIFVSIPNTTDPQKPVASVLHGDGKQELNIPQIHVELSVAEEILNKSGYSLSELQAIIDSTRKPFSISTGIMAELTIKAQYEETAEVVNVLGLLEGSDDNLKNEYIIIGAHLDHVGKQGDIIFRGANDNASGSAAVLEIARSFIKEKISPERSILFVLFASEEQGLYGAKHLADNLPCPVENVTAMFNLDCIGYGDSIQVGNGESSPKLWEIAREIDTRTDKYLVSNTWKGGGADAAPFHEKGIPALYFVSTNSYEHLHSMEDTPDSLNPDLLEKITRLAYLTAIEISDGNYKREVVIN